MKLKTSILVLTGAMLLGISPAAAQWTGCGAGIHGAMANANLTAGGPIGISSQGQTAGVEVNCDYKAQAFVFGAFVEYDKVFGDLEKLGVKTDLTVGGRAGILFNAHSLLYLHGGWTQLDVGPKLDGIKLGLGNEFRIPNSPIYMDLRYTYAIYDVQDLGAPSTVDANAHIFRLGAKLKFGPGMFGQKGPMLADDPPEVVGSDPKIPGKR